MRAISSMIATYKEHVITLEIIQHPTSWRVIYAAIKKSAHHLPKIALSHCIDNGSGPVSFGNPAASCLLARGFASPDRSGFAFIIESAQTLTS